MLAAGGRGAIRHGGSEASWTVVATPETLPTGTAGRVVQLKIVADLDGLRRALIPYRGVAQSLARAGFDGRLEELAAVAAEGGVTRVAPFDRIAFPPPWWFHDGSRPLGELLRWVELS